MERLPPPPAPPLPRRFSEWKLFETDYPMFQHRLHEVCGVWTESIHRSARSNTHPTPPTHTNPDTVAASASASSTSTCTLPCDTCCELMFLPGNPGIISYYLPFMNAVYEACDGRFGVHGFNLAGFTSLAMFQSRKRLHPTDKLQFSEKHHGKSLRHIPHHYTLDEQLAYVDGCASYVENEKRKQGFKRVHIIVIGHSAGGNLSFRLLASRARSDPERVLLHSIALFPFIRQDLPWYRRWPFLVLFSLRAVVGWLVRALSWFPMWLKLRIVAIGIPQAPSQANIKHITHSTVLTTQDPHITTNSVYLGWSEFVSIPHNQEEFSKWYEPLLSRAQGRLTFYYATKQYDQWAPASQYHELSRRYGHLAEWRSDEICGHAFCVVPEQWSQLAKRVAQDIKHAVRNTRQPQPQAPTIEQAPSSTNSTATTTATTTATAPILLHSAL